MRFRSLLLLPFLSLCASPGASHDVQAPLGAVSRNSSATSSVDNYVKWMSDVASKNLVANIGPDGHRVPGAGPGVVVASPSEEYWYTWIRDASLVYKGIINAYITSGAPHRTLIDDFVAMNEKTQHVASCSGNISSGGLGEPKFHVDGKTPFASSWGRPQADGPALRAVALITWAKHLVKKGNETYVKEAVWPIIERDAEYVAAFWNYTTYDLWEEVRSASFFTTAVQHQALRMAARFGDEYGLMSADLGSNWSDQADNTLCFLQSYWNGKFIAANTADNGRSRIDANTVLASIHTFDPDAGCDPATFQPCSDKALANLKIYVDEFRNEYAINHGVSERDAVATGRYTEDIYKCDEDVEPKVKCAHPWYLTTAAAAEQLYDALYVWKAHKNITITNTSLAFFRQFSARMQPGTHHDGSTEFHDLWQGAHALAEGFLDVLAKYTPADGSLSEQFARSDGSPRSVEHLTWSYAAMLTAFAARARLRGDGPPPPSWGARGLRVPEGECRRHRRGRGQEYVPVTFNVEAKTYWGQDVYVTGGHYILRDWKPECSIRLSADDYPQWKLTINMPIRTSMEYKYIKMWKDQSPLWEDLEENRMLCLDASAEAMQVNDAFADPGVARGQGEWESLREL